MAGYGRVRRYEGKNPGYGSDGSDGMADRDANGRTTNSQAEGLEKNGAG